MAFPYALVGRQAAGRATTLGQGRVFLNPSHISSLLAGEPEGLPWGEGDTTPSGPAQSLHTLARTPHPRSHARPALQVLSQLCAVPSFCFSSLHPAGTRWGQSTLPAMGWWQEGCGLPSTGDRFPGGLAGRHGEQSRRCKPRTANSAHPGTSAAAQPAPSPSSAFSNKWRSRL